MRLQYFINDFQVVPPGSAVIPGARDSQDIVIHKDHSEMVKYDSLADTDYMAVVSYISQMVKEAPAKVKDVWRHQTRIDSKQNQLQISMLYLMVVYRH